MGIGTFGYFEYKENGSWVADSKVGILPQGADLWCRLVGVRCDKSNKTPIAEGRGIPSDASKTVKEDYEGQKKTHPQIDGTFREEFGHSFIGVDEMPSFVRDRRGFDRLWELSDEYGESNVRLVIWFHI